MNASPMTWKLLLLRCSIVATAIVMAAVIIHGRVFGDSRVWGRYLGAIALSCIGLVLASSLICLSGHRRAALIGLAVGVSAFILGCLSPEL